MQQRTRKGAEINIYHIQGEQEPKNNRERTLVAGEVRGVVDDQDAVELRRAAVVVAAGEAIFPVAER